MTTLRNIDRTGLEARLRWSAYRGLRLLGAPGVIVVALLLAALGAELALVRPMLAQQRHALARIASQRAAQEGGGGNVAVTVAVAGAPQSDADAAQILALIERHGLTTHEVKYRQIAAGRFAAGNAGRASQATHRGGANQAHEIREARVAMALPSAGSYAQFHELIAGLSAFRGVRAESFTLRRNMPTERTLAIDLNLSMPLSPPELSATTPLPENDGSGDSSEHAGKPAFRDLFPEQDRQRELAAAAPPMPAPPPPPPQAPPLPFRLLGVWADQAQRKFILGRDGEAGADGKNGRTVIACRRCGARKTPGHIGPGDRFFDHYRLLKIEPGRLTFMYLPLSLTQAIAIDGAMRATGK